MFEKDMKTEFFLGNDCCTIQVDVNAFLNKEGVKYIDIKFGMHNAQMICILIYEIVKP